MKDIFEQYKLQTSKSASMSRGLKVKQALDLAKELGWNLIPIETDTKKCVLGSWDKYKTDTITTDEQRKEWFINQGHQIGVILGQMSANLWVLDVDSQKTAKKFVDLEDQTLTSEGRKGRRSFWFTSDYPQGTKEIAELDIEIRGEGGYCVMPPSKHPSGKDYQWINITKPKHIAGDYREEAYKIIKQKFPKFKPQRAKVHNVDELLKGVKQGERDTSAVILATWYRKAGLTEEETTEKMFLWNAKNYDTGEDGNRIPDPLPETGQGSIAEKVASAYRGEEGYNYRFNREYIQETTFSPEVMEKARKILEKGDPFKFIVKAAHEYHSGDDALLQVEWISALSSRLSPIKINSWVIGKSQKGKSHAKYTIMQLLPKEYYELFTSSSPKAFFYYVKKFGEWSLDKTLIYIDETEASKDALPTLRSLTGQTKIEPRHLSVYDGELIDLVIKGSRAVWFTSVKTFGTSQIKNRFIHTNPDETVKQDDTVWRLQRGALQYLEEPERELATVAQAIAKEVSENTINLKVKVPVDFNWPYKDRRFLYPVFMGFVHVITKVNYKHRKIEGDVLVGTEEDVQKAVDLWKTFIKSILWRVRDEAKMLLEIIPENPNNAKTFNDIAEETAIGTTKIYELLKELTDEGLISYKLRDSIGVGRKARVYWKAKLSSLGNMVVRGVRPPGDPAPPADGPSWVEIVDKKKK